MGSLLVALYAVESYKGTTKTGPMHTFLVKYAG